MDHKENLIILSKYAGERFDLIQAGGGNASVKLNNEVMLIKASGYALSEVGQSTGIVKVKRNESLSTPILKLGLSDALRPSIETFFHLILDKYVLHTHPIIVNAITCQKNWKTILLQLFPDSMQVEYHTPGIDLALAIQNKGPLPDVIFMQNHGLIIHGKNKNIVIEKTETVLLKIEKHLGISLEHFKITNKISNLIDEESYVSYLSQDETIKRLVHTNKQLLLAPPLSPDTAVYCGIGPIALSSLQDKVSIDAYKQKYNLIPKVVIYANNIFFIAQSINKAKKVEAVFKAHLLTANIAQKSLNPLPTKEILFLTDWEVEKYRTRQ
jgi:rhamnose utilization protein RhaD (predicted bifunctional aldolase and dehydrogenase)